MKDNREEIKITTCSGLLARAILSAAANEEATRRGVAEAAANLWGDSAPIFTAFLQASGAFDEDFFLRACGYEKWTVKPSGTPSTRADGLPRLRNCGLSLDFNAWIKETARFYAGNLESVLTHTTLNFPAVKNIRVKRYAPGSTPEISFTIRADKYTVMLYQKEHAQEIAWYSKTFYVDMPPVMGSRAWTAAESRGFLEYVLFKADGAAKTGKKNFLENMPRLADFYRLDESAFQAYMTDCENANYDPSCEIDRLKKQGADYVSLMGTQYQEAAARGFKRAVWEMCVEAVEEIRMLILERENPGIVRTIGA